MSEKKPLRVLMLHASVGSGHTRAAVALILRTGANGPEVLFIERAASADDPWSGDLGFPGGKMEKEDRDPRQTAERHCQLF